METFGKRTWYIYICTINNLQSAGPTIFSAVCVENDLTLTTYTKSVKLITLGKYRFPMKVNSLLNIANIRDDLSSLISDQNPNLAPKQLDIDFILRLNLILSLWIPLQDDSFKFCNIIKFVYEQLHLLTKEKCYIIHTTFYCFPPYCTTCHLMLQIFAK